MAGGETKYISTIDEEVCEYSSMAYTLAQKLREHENIYAVYNTLALNYDYEFTEEHILGVILTDDEYALYETLEKDKDKTFAHINDGTWDAYYIDDIKCLGEDIWNNEIRKTDDELALAKYIDFEKIVDERIDSGELLVNNEYGLIFKVWDKKGE